MEIFRVEKLNFAYPNYKLNLKTKDDMFALKDISFSLSEGEFATLCGKSGCGKTTLLRQLKSALTPSGYRSGDILYCGKPLGELDLLTQTAEIGYVMQRPDSQIVTDKVWHELAFGLESLGFGSDEIRRRVSEMASFFGLQSWFYRETNTLSGGQRQLLSLASVMVMQPKILILDEPTAQLDPIAASDFLQMLCRINCELGTTVLLSAHNLEDVIPVSDRVIVMEDGRIISDDAPARTVTRLKNSGSDMFLAMPSPARIYASVEDGENCPLTVREGRDWIGEFTRDRELRELPDRPVLYDPDTVVLNAKGIWFRYGKRENDILKSVSLTLHKGEWLSVVGATGVGKSTFLSVLSGVNTNYRGRVETYGNKVCMLPQDPQSVFEKETVLDDLRCGLSGGDEDFLRNVINLCDLSELLNMHPYDLSGGEQQRAALAKVLLRKPAILLLDEPTKGLDTHFKRKLAGILNNLRRSGISIIMVAHDIEFCAEYSDNCAFLFDGEIISMDEPRKFFSDNSFYTTAANRVCRNIIPEAVTTDEAIYALGGKHFRPLKKNNGSGGAKSVKTGARSFDSGAERDGGAHNVDPNEKNVKGRVRDNKRNNKKRGGGFEPDLNKIEPDAGAGPLKGMTLVGESGAVSVRAGRLSMAAAVLSFLLIPVFIFIGAAFMEDRNYYIISMIIIALAIIPFAILFEGRKPRARELVVMAVMCAFAVFGRIAFYMTPQVKPMLAVIIISGVALGCQRGFLIGVVSAFASNMFIGQGPWTPWQMLACGLIGLIAGLFSKRLDLSKPSWPLALLGGALTLFVYGGIMNPASVIMSRQSFNLGSLAAYYISGFPMDAVHAVSTFVFLLILAKPMLKKIVRVKKKYGICL